jgi:hypothetical protein
LIIHVIDADDAPEPFAMPDTSPEPALQVVFDHGGTP